MSFSSRVAALLLGLLLAACGNLPRPFQPDDKSVENPLLVLGDRAGIIVMPIAGVDNDDESHAFSEALAAALRAVDVNAHTGAGNRASPVISSFLERKPGEGAVLILWLSEPGRGDIGTFEANVVEREIMTDSPRRKQVLERVAQAVAAQVNPGAVAVPMGTPPVFIARVSGLPGSAGAPLERALDFALRRAKAEIADRPTERSLTVTGVVAFRDLPKDQVALEVNWRVIGADGAEIGTLQQKNDVPAQALQRAWPEISSAIADSAAEGIMEIVARAPRIARPR